MCKDDVTNGTDGSDHSCSLPRSRNGGHHAQVRSHSSIAQRMRHIGHDRRLCLGDEGHQIVCEIAFKQVKSSTRSAITELLRADTDNPFTTFSEACTWPDHPRKRAAEHFLNLPRDATSLTNKCGGADECVVSAIADDLAVLMSNTAPKVEKSRSLKFIGHWVGDVH